MSVDTILLFICIIDLYVVLLTLTRLKKKILH